MKSGNSRYMGIGGYSYIVVSILSQCAAFVLIKKSSETIVSHDPFAAAMFCFAILCLFLQAIFWQQVLRHFDLYKAYLLMAFVYPLLLIAGVVIFNEIITIKSVVSVVFVISGILVLNWRDNG